MTVGEIDTIAPLRHNIDVLLPLGGVTLEGFLSVPPANACGVVLFAHGSGSSRHSPRNHYVADRLYDRNLATLLIDLLTPSEEAMEAETRHLRFDIGLLADRLSQVIEWIEQHDTISCLPIGLFGASTGAAAALAVAARRRETVRAVVSRGGRPDLAGEYLRVVEAPVLLIVGGKDREVLRLNEKVLAQLNALSHLEIVPGATHLFEESGALEQVADLAAAWFERYLE